MPDEDKDFLDSMGVDYGTFEKGVNAEEALPLVMTAQEVADLLRVSYKTVLNMAKEHTIPAFMVAGQWRFGRAAILKWIDDISHEDYDPDMRKL